VAGKKHLESLRHCRRSASGVSFSEGCADAADAVIAEEKFLTETFDDVQKAETWLAAG
jgi:hypothetical protein